MIYPNHLADDDDLGSIVKEKDNWRLQMQRLCGQREICSISPLRLKICITHIFTN
jgi:hypothetical protein